MELSPREHQIVTILVWFAERRRPQPSIREIARLMGVASTSTVHFHLRKLEEKNYIARLPMQQRAISLSDKAFRLCALETRQRRTQRRRTGGAPAKPVATG